MLERISQEGLKTFLKQGISSARNLRFLAEYVIASGKEIEDPISRIELKRLAQIQALELTGNKTPTQQDIEKANLALNQAIEELEMEENK